MGEILPPQLLPPLEVEGAVVGADGVDVPGLQPRPQGVHVLPAPQGRGEDELRPLKPWQPVPALVQQQVLGAALHIEPLPPRPGGPHQLQAPGGGQVDDVHRMPRQLPDGQPAAHRLRLHRRRTGPGVGGGPQVPRRLLGGDARRHQIAVLTVTAHNAAPLPHRPHHLQRGGVGHPQVVVGKIYLIGCDPFPLQVRQLRPDSGAPVLDGHVEPVVAGGRALRPAVPRL